ncbi:MAG: hypothetical protein NTX12_05290 [Actinobacteria bacterium]|nr:hypothetical protein [Actinomycetota bacterium]
MARNRGAVFSLGVALSISALLLGTTSATGATVQLNASCPKVGVKSGSFVCTKVGNKLVWQVAKKVQKITFVTPKQVNASDGSFALAVSSSSKLPVLSVTRSPQICTITPTAILLTGSAGVCSLSFSQVGNSVFFPAPTLNAQVAVMGINMIDFQLPGALLLRQGTFALDGTSSSALPLTYISQTPEICSVSDKNLNLLSAGKCIVEASQTGNEQYPAATKVIRFVEISAHRVTADVQDSITGFQVKPIYVVPSDGIDHSYDIDGTLDEVLKDGTTYLKQELGLTIPIDSTADGFDVMYFQSSKPSDYFLNNAGSYKELMKESGLLDTPSLNRKEYVFFVDTKTIVGPGFCGEAGMPGISAVVAVGIEECGKKTTFFDNYASQTWVHEVFHNLGVPHVPSSCDLMFSGQPADGAPCPANQRLSIDIKRNMYVGANANGQDLLKLRVWDGYTSNQDLYADCWLSTVNGVPRSDGISYALCPTGTQSIGPFTYCWDRINSASLEERINGVWTSLGSGNSWNSPWGPRVSWQCLDATYVAPWKSLTVNTPGLRHYRWIVNGTVTEEFNIIWQN